MYRLLIYVYGGKAQHSWGRRRAPGMRVSGKSSYIRIFRKCRASGRMLVICIGYHVATGRWERGASTGGYPQGSLVYKVLLCSLFNKVYQESFKHLNEFILSIQPNNKSSAYYLSNHNPS